MSQPRPLITGPSVWTAPAMRAAEPAWTHRLTQEQIAEIDAAVAKNQTKDIAAITKADFPLPTLAPILARIRDDVLHGRGFAMLRGLPTQDRPIQHNAAAYWGIGTHIGAARSQNKKGHLLGHVYDLGGNTATDPHLRNYATNEKQNFHIDRSDVVGLLCLRRAKTGGLSAIASSMAVHNAMAEQRPDLLERLYQPFPFDRRGEIPPGKQAHFDAPVFNPHAGTVSVLYSSLQIRSSQRLPDARRLTDQDHEALDMLIALCGDDTYRLDIDFQPGDIQLLHNHTILHARTGYEDWPETDRKRHLLRLWLSPPGARELPPVFAECYGGITPGDRGGIVCEGTRLHAPLVPA